MQLYRLFGNLSALLVLLFGSLRPPSQVCFPSGSYGVFRYSDAKLLHFIDLLGMVSGLHLKHPAPPLQSLFQLQRYSVGGLSR